MKIIETNILGLKILKPRVFEDTRGKFIKTFNNDFFIEFGLDINIKEIYYSISHKDVIRGMHFQTPPFEHIKLVYVPAGKIIDVVLDIRKNSPTFGQHVAVELSGENKKQLLIPRGFAHGFVVLEDDTVFAYKVDNYYSPECDRGITFDDKNLNIDWILNHNELNLSAKDTKQPKLNETNDLFEFGVDYYA